MKEEVQKIKQEYNPCKPRVARRVRSHEGDLGRERLRNAWNFHMVQDVQDLLPKYVSKVR